VNGINIQEREVVEGFKTGQTAADTKVIGRTIKLISKENYTIKIKIFMKVNGLMIKRTGLDFTFIKMGQYMKAHG
jgi:hypothetical protein